MLQLSLNLSQIIKPSTTLKNIIYKSLDILSIMCILIIIHKSSQARLTKLELIVSTAI